MKQLVLASSNPGKIRELSQLLMPLRIETIPQSRFDLPHAEEPHHTFVENALAKARHAARLTGLPAVAEDSGICVDALDGAPGVLSARLAGEPRSDERNNDRLLQLLSKSDNRAAHYCCVLVLLRCEHDPEPIIAQGEWHGQILRDRRGDGGFGYDPLFLDPQLGKTGAELTLEQKNRVSHRGKALALLLERLGASGERSK